ncbi:hypothetical protein B296_00000496 [Ensete ventricosum]|uniref:Uncharacterized protein n=1 Tax=Ensete ventricosum TaxID=4639 RepID=A0A427BA33_ENSVE|nr:hypothetical protein B296_00000496 [Ensete ventricosum]
MLCKISTTFIGFKRWEAKIELDGFVLDLLCEGGSFVKCYTLVRQRLTEIQVRRLRRSHFLEELRQMGCDGWHHYCQRLHLTNEVEEHFYGNHHMPYTNLRRWEPRVIEETPMTFRGLGGSILIHPHGNKWMASREVEKVSGGYLLR